MKANNENDIENNDEELFTIYSDNSRSEYFTLLKMLINIKYDNYSDSSESFKVKFNLKKS